MGQCGILSLESEFALEENKHFSFYFISAHFISIFVVLLKITFVFLSIHINIIYMPFSIFAFSSVNVIQFQEFIKNNEDFIFLN